MKSPRIASIIAFAALASMPMFAQSPKSVERPGDGRPTCGLGKQFHAGRRAALCEKLGEGTVVCRGLPESRDYLRFRQDKTFWYLTGVESPNANLVIDVKSAKATLFLPPRNKMAESWNGELWDASDEWVKELTGIDDVRKNSELAKVLEASIAANKRVWISMSPNVALAGCADQAHGYDRGLELDPLDGRTSREKRLSERLKELYQAEVKDLSPVLDEMRRVKEPEEIAAMRRAGRSGALAMAEAMRSTRPGIGEWDLEGLMSFVQVREGAAGPAYNAIVGSGRNSLVLHYMDSSRTMQAGDTLLIDYAPEVDHYTCDITRTWPVDGKFSARQAELYDAVLAAQKAGIAAVKPGATIGQVTKACSEAIKARGFEKLQKHGPCHYIGMEVHDVGEYDKPLVPGVAFTIEPGLYEASTDIGVRIEDVVIVTAAGCEVVSDGAPRERAEIERLIREEGLLDWMDQKASSLAAQNK
jgi:Xaa-Pro aminopeptidase